MKFGANAQPFYVLLDNEGKPLNKSYAYDEDISQYINFLKTGLDNYKKKRNNILDIFIKNETSYGLVF